MYADFMEGEGRLPQGLSEKYNKTSRCGAVIRGTPFDAYLDGIRQRVDSLNDRSGISLWLHMDKSAEINAAAAQISDWVKGHRKINGLLREKCHVGNTTVFFTEAVYSGGKIMIVIDDACAFESISEDSVRSCRAADISFCTVLSDCRLYDLIERREKEITYVTYPNYHDETYADWCFI